MRILTVHNRYQQPGGEDLVVAAETCMLKANAQEVSLFEVSNQQIKGLWGKVVAALMVTYSSGARSKVFREIRSFRPDIVHVHNFFPLLTPSIYDACLDGNVPVIQTLHNYRTICPGALLMRDGKVCEDCIAGSLYKCVIRGCYRGSPIGTLAVARMVQTHRKRGTWRRKVGRYIALTSFAKGKFVQAGLPANKILIKPNFVSPDPGVGDGQGGFALFVGRLSPEKGVDTVLGAWKELGNKVPLKVVGDGPLAPKVTDASKYLQGVDWLGHKSRGEVLALMKAAAFLVFPSVWYEGFPLTLAESLAVGLPVVASDLGSMRTIIEHGRTGMLFSSGDPQDLAAKIEWLLAHPEHLLRMRREARREYEAKYTAERNYRMLIDIYEQVLN